MRRGSGKSEGRLSVNVSAERGDVTHVAVSGELDVGTAATFDERVPDMTRPGRPVILDMAGLSFLDSTGIRSLVLAKRTIEAERLSVTFRNWPPRVRRVIEAAGLVGVLAADERA